VFLYLQSHHPLHFQRIFLQILNFSPDQGDGHSASSVVNIDTPCLDVKSTPCLILVTVRPKRSDPCDSLKRQLSSVFIRIAPSCVAEALQKTVLGRRGRPRPLTSLCSYFIRPPGVLFGGRSVTRLS
jgi:hypothetical protein